MLLNDDIADQQRISKEIESFGKAGQKVILIQVPPMGRIGTNASGAEKTIHLSLTTRPLPKNLFFWGLKWAEMVLRMCWIGIKQKPDVVHAVNLITLFPAYLVACTLRIPFVYDSQEIESGVMSKARRPEWFWLWMEKSLAGKAAIVVVTDEFRFDITRKILNLDRAKMFTLMSLPKISSLTITERKLRVECKAKDKKLAVYFGVGIPGRHLEDIISAFALLPMEYVFAFVGYIEASYKYSLEKIAEKLGLMQRLIFLPPVRWHELPDYISSADCSFALYQKNSINNLYCSPSKLFDALIAGLPVIGTDNPLIKKTLSNIKAGLCIESVTAQSIAAAIKNVTSLYSHEDRERIAKDAKEIYTWESQESGFLEFYIETINVFNLETQKPGKI